MTVPKPETPIDRTVRLALALGRAETKLRQLRRWAEHGNHTDALAILNGHNPTDREDDDGLA